jgi:hypothetical protein
VWLDVGILDLQMDRLLLDRRRVPVGEERNLGANPGTEGGSSRAKSNHQGGYRCRTTIISTVAANSPDMIPPPVRVTSDKVSPVSVTARTVELPVADSSDRTTAIGITQISRKNVVTRSSFSG